MENTITLPNDLVQRAEETARQLGISLEELCSQALSRFLKARDDAEITRSLNEVYSRVDSSLDPVVMQMQLTALDEEESEWETTRKLNEIYEHEDSSPDPVLTQLQFATLDREEW